MMAGPILTRRESALAAFLRHGPMTAHELARVTGEPESLNRVTELFRCGLLRSVGKRLTPGGAPANVWALTWAGELAANS